MYGEIIKQFAIKLIFTLEIIIIMFNNERKIQCNLNYYIHALVLHVVLYIIGCNLIGKKN
jgi:hypothetical protein